MTNTSEIYSQIDTGVEECTENILYQFGISSSIAIWIFYRQIIMNQGILFDLRLSQIGLRLQGK